MTHESLFIKKKIHGELEGLCARLQKEITTMEKSMSSPEKLPVCKVASADEINNMCESVQTELGRIMAIEMELRSLLIQIDKERINRLI